MSELRLFLISSAAYHLQFCLDFEYLVPLRALQEQFKTTRIHSQRGQMDGEKVEKVLAKYTGLGIEAIIFGTNNTMDALIL